VTHAVTAAVNTPNLNETTKQFQRTRGQHSGTHLSQRPTMFWLRRLWKAPENAVFCRRGRLCDPIQHQTHQSITSAYGIHGTTTQGNFVNASKPSALASPSHVPFHAFNPFLPRRIATPPVVARISKSPVIKESSLISFSRGSSISVMEFKLELFIVFIWISIVP
jgi:hypothetical protein